MEEDFKDLHLLVHTFSHPHTRFLKTLSRISVIFPSQLFMSKKKKKTFLKASQHPSPLCGCRCDPQKLAGSAWLCYSCWGDGHGTGSVYILPREHLVFIRLFKNPPQPLRPDWRVACIGAHCLPAGHRSEDTHTYTLIFPHKDNRVVAAGLLCFFLHAFVHKNTSLSFSQQLCFNPRWMETKGIIPAESAIRLTS